MNLLWKPHNLASLRVIKAQIPALADLPRKTAALHMVFGILLISGVLLS